MVRKKDKDKIFNFSDVDTSGMNKEQLAQFLDRVSHYYDSLNWAQVDELESDFDLKSRLLVERDYSELSLSEFIELVFERGERSSGCPFEEIQSKEYVYWKEQKRRLGLKLEGASAESGSAEPSLQTYSHTMLEQVEKEKVRVNERERPNLSVDYSGYRMWRYNPIIFYKEEKKALHRILLKDDEETMAFLENRKFAIMPPVTFVGNTNSYRNARFLYAFAIDLDGVGLEEVTWFLNGMRNGLYPEANIIVNSGHGVHVYYLLAKPIAMYETRLKALNKLKARLTKLIWVVSKLGVEKAQVQSVVQGFRLPGTLTKFGKKVEAYWDRWAPLHTIEELNSFLSDMSSSGVAKLTVEELKQISSDPKYNPARVTKAQAAKEWPEWYASRVIAKKRVGKSWKVNRGLYDWWLAILNDGKSAEVHHRYWCILTLVIFAVKCGIPKDVVLADALALVPAFDRKTVSVDNQFTDQDVHDAMRAYDAEYNKWPRKVIESTTGIRIMPCRRNHRSQETHIKLMTVIRDGVTHPNGSWRDGNGRKKGSTVDASDSRCAAIVREWQGKHPGNTNKSLCARETGLDRKTVRKWWNAL